MPRVSGLTIVTPDGEYTISTLDNRVYLTHALRGEIASWDYADPGWKLEVFEKLDIASERLILNAMSCIR